MCLPWNHKYEIKESVRQLSTLEIMKGEPFHCKAHMLRPAVLVTVVQCKACYKVKHIRTEL